VLDRDRSLEAIKLAAPIFDKVASRTRLLDALNWPREIEERFFAKGASALPEVKYEIDRARIEENVAALEGLAMTLDVGDPIQRWLVDVSRSYLDGNRLLLAIGTERFHEISVDLYGGPRSVFDKDSTNLDLASHLEARLAGEVPVLPKKGSELDPKSFGKALEGLADSIGMQIETVVDDDVSAKVVAGTDRVRIRGGTRFKKVEVEGLFVHEVETHALTAQNGAAQPLLKFLKSGGPRTTRTQEGLAVFAEFHAHALSVERMRRIVRRVRLVEMAESGASFLDLYRWLVEQGSDERNAYFDAARICRGGLLTGRAPFTKDSSYLAGFMEVYNFLQVAVRGGARESVHLLVAGRLALDDLHVLHELRARGLLAPPKLMPRWMEDWDALLPYFAFTSFLQEIDLGQVESRHRKLLQETAGA
jgi:uncharacterized protein (TIGR02421 family)